MADTVREKLAAIIKLTSSNGRSATVNGVQVRGDREIVHDLATDALAMLDEMGRDHEDGLTYEGTVLSSHFNNFGSLQVVVELPGVLGSLPDLAAVELVVLGPRISSHSEDGWVRCRTRMHLNHRRPATTRTSSRT